MSCCVWLAVSGSIDAQSTPTEIGDSSLVPPAPQNHVLDGAVLFREQPETLVEVQESLRRMEKDYGYPVYLSIYYNVYDGNLQARADSLHKAWIGESSRGMVIVYQLDPVVSGNNPTIAFYKGSDLDSDLTSESKTRLISGPEVEAMLARVFANQKETKENQIPFITSLVYGIESEIVNYHKVQPASWSDEDNLKLMAVFLGVITGLALLGMLLWKLFSHADAKSSKTHYFPEVRVGRRLEAPFGGGWVSEKTFVPASSRR